MDTTRALKLARQYATSVGAVSSIQLGLNNEAAVVGAFERGYYAGYAEGQAAVNRKETPLEPDAELPVRGQ